MKQSYEQALWEFHNTYDAHRSARPGLPNQDVRELRKNLLEEEYKEYLQAEADNDLTEIADALGDIIYIAVGTAVAYGIPMDRIFEEIHRSNMSKLDPQTGLPIRRADGKILKGANFTPPDLEKILADHAEND